MFAPRGYTALPQDAIDEEDEDQLHLAINEQQTSRFVNVENMDQEIPPIEKEQQKEPRRKRNHVRFAKSMDEEQEPLSNARRLCFVLSLMICTLTIFVFAFTVPCKRASCSVTNMVTTTTQKKLIFHGNWSREYPGLSSDAGITLHENTAETNGEVIVSYNAVPNNPKRKRSHVIQNGGLISLNEQNGALVWLYNASFAKRLIVCKTDMNKSELCLIESVHGELQLVVPRHNKIIWSTSILLGAELPSIIINIADCDGDGVTDVLLSYDRFDVIHTGNKTNQTVPGQLQVISGRTGQRVGEILTIPQTHLIKRVSLHSTSQTTNIIFVLNVGVKGDLQVVPIKKLYEEIVHAKLGVSTDLFNNSKVQLSRLVSLNHPPVVKDINEDYVDDIVLVTLAGNKHSLTAVDGGDWKKIWRITFGTRKILSSPVIGHFNDDKIPDILVVLQDPVLETFNQSLVQILNGQNGKILWSRKLTIASSTTPISVNIGQKRDMFFIWVEKEKVQEYVKILPLEKQHSDGQATGNHLPSKKSESTTNRRERYLARHRRDELPSVANEQKVKSSIRDLEAELDTLVEEIKEQHNRPTAVTQAAKVNTERLGRVLEILQQNRARGTVTEAPTKKAEKEIDLKQLLINNKPNSMENKASSQYQPTKIAPVEKSNEKEIPPVAPTQHQKKDSDLNFKQLLIDNSLDNPEHKATTSYHQPTSLIPITKSDEISSVAPTEKQQKGSELNTKQLSIKNKVARKKEISTTLYHSPTNLVTVTSTRKTPSVQQESVENSLKKELDASQKISTDLPTLKTQELSKQTSSENSSEKEMEALQTDVSALKRQKTAKQALRKKNSSIDANENIGKTAGNIRTVTDQSKKHSSKVNVSKSDLSREKVVKKVLEDPIAHKRLNKNLIKNKPTISGNAVEISKVNSSLVGNNKLSKTKKMVSEEILKSVANREGNSSQEEHRNIKENNSGGKKNDSRSTISELSTQQSRFTPIPSDNPNNPNLTNLLDNGLKPPQNISSKVRIQTVKKTARNSSNASERFQNSIVERRTNSSTESVSGNNHTTTADNGNQGKQNTTENKNQNNLPKAHLNLPKVQQLTNQSLVKNISLASTTQEKKNTTFEEEPNNNNTTMEQRTPIFKSNRSDINNNTIKSIDNNATVRLRTINLHTKVRTSKVDNKRRTSRCEIPHGFSLIAIFPNSPKNSYTVISQEDSYSSKTLDPYEIFCPSVNSNPVIRDADQDGYVEIFYVVNYYQKFKRDSTMKITKFNINVNAKLP